MIVLDASVLVAHLSPLDAHHTAATELLHNTADELWLVHTMTLAEVLVGGAKVGKGTEMLADLRLTTGLKLSDCCVLDAAQTNAAQLATFDTALSTAASRLGVALIS